VGGAGGGGEKRERLEMKRTVRARQRRECAAAVRVVCDIKAELEELF